MYQLVIRKPVLCTLINIIMQHQKISFTHSNGQIDGIYLNAGENTPLVIIANGHNGFYNYGMFPYIQQSFLQSGISSYSFNYSHGGVLGDSDYFSDLDKYEKNCIRLEKEDIVCAVENLASDNICKHPEIFLFTHSLGGAPTIFATKELEHSMLKPAGIMLVSSVMTLNFWGETMINKWKETGVFFKKNNRTNQELPLGKEFLEEVLNCDHEWSIEKAIKELKTPILIIHGDKDEAVPLESSLSLYEWSKNNNPKNELEIIKDATHTFNTKHPFAGTTGALESLIAVTINRIKNL